MLYVVSYCVYGQRMISLPSPPFWIAPLLQGQRGDSQALGQRGAGGHLLRQHDGAVPRPGPSLPPQEARPPGRVQDGDQADKVFSQVAICLLLPGKGGRDVPTNYLWWSGD